MVSINLTLFIEIGLFLIFFWVTKRIVLGPLTDLMEARAKKTAQEEAEATKNAQEAETMEVRYRSQLTEAHQEASHRLHQARSEANRELRHEYEQRLHKADQEVAEYQAEVEKTLEAERVRYRETLPELVDAMDRQVHSEGGLL